MSNIAETAPNLMLVYSYGGTSSEDLIWECCFPDRFPISGQPIAMMLSCLNSDIRFFPDGDGRSSHAFDI